jgi:hypothetical protein
MTRKCPTCHESTVPAWRWLAGATPVPIQCDRCGSYVALKSSGLIVWTIALLQTMVVFGAVFVVVLTGSLWPLLVGVLLAMALPALPAFSLPLISVGQQEYAQARRKRLLLLFGLAVIVLLAGIMF